MTRNPQVHLQITDIAWNAIQADAKAAAQTAMATNNTKGLTALGWGYYHAIKDTK